MTLLSDHGLINTFLTGWGLIDEPLPLLHNEYSVLVGLVYTYLPFMILPLYASLDRLDRSVLEALRAIGWTIQRPRPRHARVATSDEQAAFKKTSPQWSPRSRPVILRR